MKKKLSICIPTYNRTEQCIETIKLIESRILDEASSELVDIFVSDNGSTDCSHDVLLQAIKDIKVEVKCHFFGSNQGIDRNIEKAIEMADGEYVWTFGDDDYMHPGAIKYIMEEINKGFDIILCNRSEGVKENNYDNYKKRHWLKDSIKGNKTYDFHEKETLGRYFCDCQSLGGVFSFISSNIVKKCAWDYALSHSNYNNKYMGSCYAHSAILCYLLKNGNCVLEYINDALVAANVGTSFSGYENYYKRTMLDFDGIIQLSHIFDEIPEIKEDFLSIIRNEHPSLDVLKVTRMKKKEKKALLSKMKEAGYKQRQLNQLSIVTNWRISPFFFWAKLCCESKKEDVRRYLHK